MPPPKKHSKRVPAIDPITEEAPEVRIGRFRDSLQNLMTGMGTTRDKRSYTRVRARGRTAVSDLDTQFVEDDLTFNIVSAPAEDMTREGWDLQGDHAEAIELELERIGTQAAIFEALQWSRLHGGALVVVGLDKQTAMPDDADEPDLSQPRQPGRVLWLQVYDRHEVNGVELNALGDVETYIVSVETAADDGTRKAKAVRIHASRCLRFDDAPAPRRVREAAGWGVSIMDRCGEPVKELNTAMAGVGVAVGNFSDTVLRLKGLTDILASDKAGSAKGRISQMSLMRSQYGMMVLDGEDNLGEVARNFAGVPDILDRLAERVSSASGVPVTRMFGRAPAGLNATGDSDIRNYYDRCASGQRLKVLPALVRLITIIAEGMSLDLVKAPVRVLFMPLWTPTSKEQADTHFTQAQTDKLYVELGVVDVGEVTKSRFSRSGYSVETEIDWEAREALKAEEGDDDLLDPKLAGGGAAGEDVQKTALNGAQVASAVDIVSKVALKQLPRDTGLGMLETFFGLSPKEAEDIMRSVGKTFFVAAPVTLPTVE